MTNIKKAYEGIKKIWNDILYHDLIIAVLALTIITFCYVFNSDAWFLLNTGKYIVANGIPTIEPFTLHENFKFVVQQWLFCVYVYGVYNYFGMTGMFVFSSAICFAVALVVFKICKLLNKDPRVCRILFFFVVIFFCVPYNCNRPNVVSCLFLMLELYFLEMYVKSENAKYLIALPIISALIVNFHAAMWFMVIVFMLPYLVNSFSFSFLSIPSRGFKKLPLFAALIGIVIAGFVNPYGIKSMMYLVGSFGIPEINKLIGEMHPLTFETEMGKITFFMFLALICFYCSTGRKKLQIRFVLLSLGTMVLTLMAVRGFIFFVLCGTVSLSALLSCVNEEKAKQEPADTDAEISEKDIKKRKLVSLYAVGVMIVGCVYVIATNERVINMPYYDDPLKACADYLEGNLATQDIVLYTNYNDGGYMEFRGFRPYIDPRAEVFLKANNGQKDVFIEYYDLQNGKLYYKDFINTYGFTHFLIDSQKDQLFLLLANDPDYKETYSDDKWYIYEKIN